MSRNQLDQETSPYLLLHKDNPVHWRSWGPEALAEAEAHNKPILLSIGYTACHWCHVMNHESFADPATAELMNEKFVNIKVDREERPDIDQIYQTAIAVMGGQGGWPLTMFLTPKGEPYFAGTYFPNVESYGRPSFQSALNHAASIFHERGEEAARNAAAIGDQLATLWGRDQRGPILAETIDRAAIHIGQRFDVFYGGMTGSPKFPNFANTEILLRAYLRTGLPPFHTLAQTTLHHICMGGIYDHLGGGMARYSTDEVWLVPHFEKMLSDNAQLIHILTFAWQHDRNVLYRARIEETVNWLMRDMMVEQAFAASIDADSEGEEGKYYLWTEAEVDAALAGTFAAKFKQVYNITRAGNYQGRNILFRKGPNSGFPLSEADENLLAKQREMLLAQRQKRIAPLRDDKVLADWNGAAIAALATAGAVLRKTAWTVAAVRAFEFIERALCDAPLMYHSWRDGKRGAAAFADDYAHMARAALTLWETTNDKRYLARAIEWVRTLNEHFWDMQNGGYFVTPDFADPLIARPRYVADQAFPCANGIMPEVLARLYFATMDEAYRDRSNALIQAFSGEVTRVPVSVPSFINSLEMLMTGLQIIIVGSLTNPKTHELVSAVLGR
ncbi:MAG TPA: thioredoxin domain-containing protein, partial [Rhizomicrobium sp.]|nr:thioredoxin domain-containing protein [Rhizomicrobium sp.]